MSKSTKTEKYIITITNVKSSSDVTISHPITLNFYINLNTNITSEEKQSLKSQIAKSYLVDVTNVTLIKLSFINNFAKFV